MISTCARSPGGRSKPHGPQLPNNSRESPPILEAGRPRRRRGAGLVPPEASLRGAHTAVSKSLSFPVRDPGQSKMGASLSPRPCPPGHAGQPYPLRAGDRPPWRLTPQELAPATGFTPRARSRPVSDRHRLTDEMGGGGARLTPCPQLESRGTGATLGGLGPDHPAALPL